MKWRGRRQSTNLVDITLRGINIFWYDANKPASNAITIDTDGTVYAEGTSEYTTNIAIVPILKANNQGNIEQLTTAQKLTLQILIDDMIYAGGGSVSLNPPDDSNVVLVQYVQTILNNN